jgi:uncharacterized protein (AIM24 family)
VVDSSPGLRARSVGERSSSPDFTAWREGNVAFAPRFLGTIIPAVLRPAQSLICRKETFLVAEKSVAAKESRPDASLPGDSIATVD